MRVYLAISITLMLVCGCSVSVASETGSVLDRGVVVTVAADPAQGFHWPYHLFIPKNLESATAPLLVLPNNTGSADDDFAVHEASALRDLQRFGRRFTSDGLAGVLLQPVFPRFKERMGGWRYYTHALDRDSLLIGTGQYFEESKVAITIAWSGQPMGKNSSMSFSLDDLFVVQDGLVSKCVAADWNPREAFTGVATFAITLLFDGNWDPSRAFNLIEYGSPEHCFRFTNVQQREGAIRNAQAANMPEFRITAIGNTTGADFAQLWNADGAEISDADLEPLRRLDQQMLAMISDARDRLSSKAGIILAKKINLYGFSAAASFSDRFTALHPEKVHAIAAGGFNGLLVIPQAQINGVDLRYPLGLSDFAQVSGHPFDSTAFAAVKRFYFMGSDDTNDAALYRDSYARVDEELIMAHLGPDPVSRIPVLEELFAQVCRDNVIFRLYDDVGHEITDAIRSDLVAFLKEAGF